MSASSGSGKSAGSMTIGAAISLVEMSLAPSPVRSTVSSAGTRSSVRRSLQREQTEPARMLWSHLAAALASPQRKRSGSETGMPAVKVFMSYRRVDNPFLAGRLKDELGRVFGDENVFYDVDSIRARLRFP